MKVTVIVTIKPSILDPQGNTIRRTIAPLGYTAITDLRQGKVFEIEMEEAFDKKTARKEINKLAKEVLTNPVIEEYKIIWK